MPIGLALAVGSMLAKGALAYALMAASVVYGIYTARDQRKRAQRALARETKDRTVMFRSATGDRPHIFGRVRLSGPMHPCGSSGTYKERLHYVVALGDEIDAIEEVWFGDQEVGPRDSNGWAIAGSPYFAQLGSGVMTLDATVSATGVVSLASSLGPVFAILGVALVGEPTTDEPTPSLPFTYTGGILTVPNQVGKLVRVSYRYLLVESRARAKAYLGAPGQVADPYLVSELPGIWTADRRADGTSYLAVTNVFDENLYPTGIPNVSAVVRGELCYDPRTTATVWTRNPALIARVYIKKAFGVADSRIDDTSIIDAANACDELVPIDGDSGTHARYTFDDVIPSDMNPRDALERILQSMVGTAVESGGKWFMWAGIWQEPDSGMELGEDDLADAQIVIQPMQARRDLFNGVAGKYMDPVRWVEDSFPPYVSPAYVAQDGGEQIILDVDLTMVTDAMRAQRIAKLLLHKARQSLTFSATFSMNAYHVTPGDMVLITMPRYGFSAKPFRCLDREYDVVNSVVTLLFQEDAEAHYAWNYQEAVGVDPAPNTNLPSVRVVEAPVLTIQSGSQFRIVNTDGSVRPFMRIGWQVYDANTSQGGHIQILWRREVDQTFTVEPNVPAYLQSWDVFNISAGGAYIVQVRAVNGIGVSSEWTAQRVVVDPTAPANAGSVLLGIGANQLPNSRMTNTPTGWFAWCDNQSVPVTDIGPATTINGRVYRATRIHANSPVFGYAANHRPAPYNAAALIVQSGSPFTFQSNQAFLLHELFMPVSPGMRIEAQAMAASINAGAMIAIAGYNSTGTFVGYLPYEVPTDAYLLNAAESKTGNLTLDSFKRLYTFGTVPPGVVNVRFFLRASRISAGTSSYIFCGMSYLGYAHAGQTQPSPWLPGPSGGAMEGMDSIMTVLEDNRDGPIAIPVANPNVITRIGSIPFTAPFNCYVNIDGAVGEISGTTQQSGGNTSGPHISLRIMGEGAIVSGGTGFVYIGSDRGIGGPYTALFGGSVSASAVMNAGQSMTFLLDALAWPTHTSWSPPGNFLATGTKFKLTITPRS